MTRGVVVRSIWRFLAVAGSGALPLLSCASSGKDDAAQGSWTCFNTKDEKEPCQCQTTPVGGKQEIVDHCTADSVRVGSEPVAAECCKDWIWLNGKRESAYYCSCYVKGERNCNTDIGDELVDRCP